MGGNVDGLPRVRSEKEPEPSTPSVAILQRRGGGASAAEPLQAPAGTAPPRSVLGSAAGAWAGASCPVTPACSLELVHSQQ